MIFASAYAISRGFFSSISMLNAAPKLLLLTAGYGDGHNSAAYALAQCAEARGWIAEVIDPCQKASPRIFSLTQSFYKFCVTSASWIWGITYYQTETADWSTKATAPILRKVTNCIKAVIDAFQPDVVLCTYPLYAYMLDYLRNIGEIALPYGVVVTDSLEISRSWMLSNADVYYLPDEHSAQLVMERFALPQSRVYNSGFPVRAAFNGRLSMKTPPSTQDFRIVYGAYAPVKRVRTDVRAINNAFPQAQITVLAGNRFQSFARLQNDKVTVIKRTDDMPLLFEKAHLYIGKAGAATMYEAYSMHLPVIVNYSLPGQEQGNIALLLKDACGRCVDTTPDLLTLLQKLLADNATMWQSWRAAMISANRKDGALHIIDDIQRRFFV